MLWKCYTQYASKFGKLTEDWKRSIFIPIPKKGNAKECSNYRPVALISHASKVMLKIFQARLQKYVNQELSDVQAGFRKGRGTRDQKTNILWITKKCGKFWKRWEYQTTWSASWEICMQVRKQQLERNMEQQTVSK